MADDALHALAINESFNKSPQLIIISGISGAGKTTALRALESLGYLAVDNLPPNLLKPLLLEEPAGKIAVTIDARQPEWSELPEALKGIEYKLLLLEARFETILTRYQETRQRHPASRESVLAGYEYESLLLPSLRPYASWTIRTDGMASGDLRKEIENLVEHYDTMSLNIVSFGWKWSPFQGDMVFDARHLPNPYWDPELRSLSGTDERAVAYIKKDGAFDRWCDELDTMLSWLIPRYIESGKTYLDIGFGCTGGRHRSVATAEELHRRLHEFSPRLIHRDRDRAGNKGGI